MRDAPYPSTLTRCSTFLGSSLDIGRSGTGAPQGRPSPRGPASSSTRTAARLSAIAQCSACFPVRSIPPENVRAISEVRQVRRIPGDEVVHPDDLVSSSDQVVDQMGP